MNKDFHTTILFLFLILLTKLTNQVRLTYPFYSDLEYFTLHKKMIYQTRRISPFAPPTSCTNLFSHSFQLYCHRFSSTHHLLYILHCHNMLKGFHLWISLLHYVSLTSSFLTSSILLFLPITYRLCISTALSSDHFGSGNTKVLYTYIRIRPSTLSSNLSHTLHLKSSYFL